MATPTFTPQGFLVNENFPISNVAGLSLSIALDAYISTFKDIQDKIHFFNDPHTQYTVNQLYSGAYVEHACEAIMHIQHFAELYVKDILQAEHPLLVADAGAKPDLLFDILSGNSYSPSELDGLKQIEFSAALQRIVELLKKQKIDSKYDFILDYRTMLEHINKLRNRIAHRGIFVLYMQSLDELFGRYVLPFLGEVFQVESKFSRDAYFKKTKAGFSPFDELMDLYKTRPYDIREVGLLKEIARAVHKDEIFGVPIMKMFDNEKIEKLEAAADFEEKMSYGSHEVHVCPVCGQKTFMLHWDAVDDEDDEGNVLEHYEYVYKVVCLNCTFELSNNMYNVKVNNFDMSPYFKKR